MESTTITVHQLVVGMTIRNHTHEGDIIISNLIAEDTDGISIQDNNFKDNDTYLWFDINETFELVEPFDLTKCNLNWINESLKEIEEDHNLFLMQCLMWGTITEFEQAEVVITPYKLNGTNLELIENTIFLVLKKEAFQFFFEQLGKNEPAVRIIAVSGHLQCESKKADGTPLNSSLITVQEFSDAIQPLLESNTVSTINHWKQLGCEFIKLDFVAYRYR